MPAGLRFAVCLLSLYIGVLFCSPLLAADDYTWLGGNGSFTSNNWDLGSPPGNGDTANIDTSSVAGNYTVTLSSSVDLGTGDLTIIGQTPNSASLEILSGGSLNARGVGIIGDTALLHVFSGGSVSSSFLTSMYSSSTLIVDAGGSVAFGPNSFVYAGSTIQGEGTITGKVDMAVAATPFAGGNIKVGDGTVAGQTLTLGSLDFDNSNNALYVGIKDDGDAGTGNSSILAFTDSSPLTVENSGVLEVYLTKDTDLAISSNTYTFITSTETISGVSAANFNFHSVGFTFATAPVVNIGTNSISVTFTPVPEPMTILGIGGFGLAAFGAWRRKRTLATV